MKRIVLVSGVVLAGASVAAGGYYFTTKDDNPQVIPNTQFIEDESSPAGTNTNYELKSVDDVLANESQPQIDTYNELISYAFLKQTAGRYDEALEYFKAASLNATSEELRDEADRLIYYMAVEYEDDVLIKEYELILGDKLQQNLVESAGEDGVR